MIDASTEEARRLLSAALGVQRWVDEVADGGPYDSVDALVAAGDAADAELTDAELDEAVAHHPRIGERAGGEGASMRLSAGEQAGLGASMRLSAGEQAGLGRSDEGLDAVIARGNLVYEQRFGRVFLIRAAGRDRQQIADELQRRLKNDPAEEAAEAKEQLRQIAALRVRTLFEEHA